MAPELLRHSNARITSDLYTQALSSQKREANDKSVEMLLPTSWIDGKASAPFSTLVDQHALV